MFLYIYIYSFDFLISNSIVTHLSSLCITFFLWSRHLLTFFHSKFYFTKFFKSPVLSNLSIESILPYSPFLNFGFQFLFVFRNLIMALKENLSAQEKVTQDIVVKAKTIGDEGLDKLKRFRCLPDDITLRRIDTEGENWRYIPNFVDPNKIILGRHLQYLRFPLPPLLHYFFALIGIHLMQFNANSIVVLNALFVLGFLHDKDLDFNFIASTYDIKAIKHKAYLTFSLQPKRNVNVFAGLPTSDKTWDNDLKGLYVVGGNWPSLTVDPKQFPILRVFTKGKIFYFFIFHSESSHLTRHSLLPLLYFLFLLLYGSNNSIKLEPQ